MKTRPYKELSELPAESYLNPDNFITEFDTGMPNEEYAKKKYEEGLAIGKEYGAIFINDRSVWSAAMLGSGLTHSLSSSEGIGYHRNTKELLQGFIDSKAEITVTRYIDGKITQTVIQKNTQNLELDEEQEVKKGKKLKP